MYPSNHIYIYIYIYIFGYFISVYGDVKVFSLQKELVLLFFLLLKQWLLLLLIIVFARKQLSEDNERSRCV